MTEEIVYALSDISSALSVFRQPSSIWQELTKVEAERPYWRTRWDAETGLLIEEEDASKTHWGDWMVTKTHRGLKDRTEAILLAAHLTQLRRAALENTSFSEGIKHQPGVSAKLTDDIAF